MNKKIVIALVVVAVVGVVIALIYDSEWIASLFGALGLGGLFGRKKPDPDIVEAEAARDQADTARANAEAAAEEWDAARENASAALDQTREALARVDDDIAAEAEAREALVANDVGDQADKDQAAIDEGELPELLI